MPSDLKSDTARINGAKSNGPKTPEERKPLPKIPLNMATPCAAPSYCGAKARMNSTHGHRPPAHPPLRLRRNPFSSTAK